MDLSIFNWLSRQAESADSQFLANAVNHAAFVFNSWVIVAVVLTVIIVVSMIPREEVMLLVSVFACLAIVWLHFDAAYYATGDILPDNPTRIVLTTLAVGSVVILGFKITRLAWRGRH